MTELSHSIHLTLLAMIHSLTCTQSKLTICLVMLPSSSTQKILFPAKYHHCHLMSVLPATREHYTNGYPSSFSLPSLSQSVLFSFSSIQLCRASRAAREYDCMKKGNLVSRRVHIEVCHYLSTT